MDGYNLGDRRVLPAFEGEYALFMDVSIVSIVDNLF